MIVLGHESVKKKMIVRGATMPIFWRILLQLLSWHCSAPQKNATIRQNELISFRSLYGQCFLVLLSPFFLFLFGVVSLEWGPQYQSNPAHRLPSINFKDQPIKPWLDWTGLDWAGLAWASHVCKKKMDLILLNIQLFYLFN